MAKLARMPSRLGRRLTAQERIQQKTARDRDVKRLIELKLGAGGSPIFDAVGRALGEVRAEAYAGDDDFELMDEPQLANGADEARDATVTRGVIVAGADTGLSQ